MFYSVAWNVNSWKQCTIEASKANILVCRGEEKKNINTDNTNKKNDNSVI